MKATAILTLIFGTLAWSQAVPREKAVERIVMSGRAKGGTSPWLSPSRLRMVTPVQHWLPAAHDGPCSVRMPGMDAMKNWQGDPKIAVVPGAGHTMPQASVPAPPCPAK